MNRIQRLSIYFIQLFNLLMCLLPLSLVFEFYMLNTAQMHNVLVENLFQQFVQTPLNVVKLSSVSWTPWTQIIKLLGDALKLLPFFLSLFVLKAIFRNYRQGDIFNFSNAHHYRSLGWLLFLDATLAAPIGNMLNVLAVTLSNPKGLRYISISVGTPNLKAIFCGALVIIISWIILEAGKLHEEQKLTI